MIVRNIDGVVKVLNFTFTKKQEDEFISKNSTGGFMKVQSLPFSKFSNWKIVDNKIVVDTDADDILFLKQKNKAIETHIYDNYSKDKQAQDNGWVSNFTTKLVASGVTDLDKQVVDFASSFLKGSSLNEVLADVDDAVKPMFEKLVKVAVKNEWCYEVIQEGKLAIKENREPVYAEFPKFD